MGRFGRAWAFVSVPNLFWKNVKGLSASERGVDPVRLTAPRLGGIECSMLSNPAGVCVSWIEYRRPLLAGEGIARKLAYGVEGVHSQRDDSYRAGCGLRQK